MILFVDDEVSTDLFIDEMKARDLPVKVFHSVDDAWRFLDKTKKPLDIAILDVMMPPGDLFDLTRTNDGLSTGLRFYVLVRQKFPDCPVFILTNLTSPVVTEAVAGDDSAFVKIKTDVFYDDFAEEVEKVYRAVRKADSEEV